MAAPYRIELPGGVLLEPVPADAESCYLLSGVDGLDGAELRDSADVAPDRDGDIPGPVLRTSRSITLDVTVVGLDRVDTQTRVATLRRAMRPTTGLWPLRIHGRVPGPDVLEVMVRPSQPFAAADGDTWRRRLHDCQLVVRAPDPRLIDPTWRTSVVYPPVASGGVDFPIEFPVDFDGAAYAGTPIVTAGDDDTWPQLTIHGPITDPVVANATLGQSIAIDGTVNAGETLVIDPLARTVTDGATGASRYSDVDRSVTAWWPLVPGSNQLALTGTSTDSTTRLGVLWRDAWL